MNLRTKILLGIGIFILISTIVLFGTSLVNSEELIAHAIRLDPRVDELIIEVDALQTQVAYLEENIEILWGFHQTIEPTETPLPTNTLQPTITFTPTPTTTPIPTVTNTPLPTTTNIPVPTVTNTPQPTVEPSGDCTHYIALNGNDNNPGTINEPWLSAIKANNVSVGSVVCFREGTYVTNTNLNWTKNGNGIWTTWMSYPGETATISQVSSSDIVTIGIYNVTGLSYDDVPSYLILKNLIFEGNAVANKGIRIQTAHHIKIIGNIIRNAGSSGISSIDGIDHLEISDNIIHGNSNVYAPCSSGISIWSSACPWGESTRCKILNDGASGYHIIIRNNKIFDNRNDDSACAFDGTPPSDGNGIIMDNNGGDNPQTLIMNNAIFHNGGMCLNLLNTGNIDVFSNTCYHNVETPRLTENGNAEIVISNHCSLGEWADGAVHDLNVYNNIFYGNGLATIARVWATDGCVPEYTADFNLFYNGIWNGGFILGTEGILDEDPQFLNPGFDLSSNFRLAWSSPAINQGANLGIYYDYDYDYVKRGEDGYWDIGAYEYTD